MFVKRYEDFVVIEKDVKFTNQKHAHELETLRKKRKQCNDEPDAAPGPDAVPALVDAAPAPARKKYLTTWYGKGENKNDAKGLADALIEISTAEQAGLINLENRVAITDAEIARVARKKTAIETHAAKKKMALKKAYDSYNLMVARREVIAQELFRLLMPHITYPKTRLAIDAAQKPRVLSKEIPGYKTLVGYHNNRLFDNKIKSGNLTGLGDILVFSLLLNEIDLKFHNMGTNSQQQLIKLDGDWCFASTEREHNYSITERIIRFLPAPDSYEAHAWLNYLIESKKGDESILDEAMKTLPHLREEINGALLRVLTLPEIFFPPYIQKGLVADAKDEGAQNDAYKLSEIFITRLKQLKIAAMQNKSFNDYLASDAANEHFEMYHDYLRTFEAAKKHVPFTPEYEAMARENFAAFRAAGSALRSAGVVPR